MKLIINTDDLGLTHEANLGIELAYKHGIPTESTLVCNSEFSEEGAKLAWDMGFADHVGVHFNLGECRPLTDAIKAFPKYCTPEGDFDHNSVFMEKATYGHSPFLTYMGEYLEDSFAREVEAVRQEVDAQIQRFKSFGFTCRHFDAHRNSILDLVIHLAAKPVIEAEGFVTTRPVFDSFTNGDLYNAMYRTWIEAEHAAMGLKTCCYTSSAPRFARRRDDLNLGPDDIAEIYVHPIFVDGELIDNLTGGQKLLEDTAILRDYDKTSYFEL